jgi:hypothetical protein
MMAGLSLILPVARADDDTILHVTFSRRTLDIVRLDMEFLFDGGFSPRILGRHRTRLCPFRIFVSLA